MQVPVHTVVKNLPNAPAVRAEVAKAADALTRFHKRITACRVSVTNPDKRHSHGGLFDVHVVLTLPGHPDIVISRRAEDHPECEHLAVSLRKAFAQARRRLQNTVREMRGEVKAHLPKAIKRVGLS